MKYSIATLAFTAFAAATGNAQPAHQPVQSSTTANPRESSAPKTVWFSAEGSNYYLTTGCQPNSGIAWYSHRWGGKLLNTSVANASGEIRLQEDKTFTPAFALSQKERGGNGTVGFTEAAEFSLESVKAVMAGGIITITWKASAAAGQPTVFEVLKAAPGGAFSVAGSYKAADAKETFVFTELQSIAGTQYRIRVRNEIAGERYLSRPLLQKAGGAAAVSIYPTVVKDALTIYAEGSATAHYMITAADGRAVAQGILQDGLQTISLGALVSGAYLVTVKAETAISSVKIVKE